MPRIVLVHPYKPSMAPIEAAFAQLWPEADVLSLLDETLYADVTAEGAMKPDVPDRIANLLRHAVASGAEGIVFTGSTFGPAVDQARRGLDVPVLKADEAMALEASRRGGSVLLVCTAARALPVLSDNLRRAAGMTGETLDITNLVVAEAKQALVDGNRNRHDDLIIAAISEQPVPDSLLLGQMSMGSLVARLPKPLQHVAITAADASVRHLRQKLG